MEIMVEMLTERIEIAEGTGMEPDLMQYKISHALYIFLETKGVNAWQERKDFLGEFLAETREETEAEQEDNPSGTQDTTDDMTTLQL